MVDKLESGPAEVVTSGSVISFLGNPITITFKAEDEILKLIFEFRDEKEKKEPRMEVSLPNPETLKIILFNFRDPLGLGTGKPARIGTIGNRNLYLQYRVYPISGSLDKILHYTLYKGEEVSTNG